MQKREFHIGHSKVRDAFFYDSEIMDDSYIKYILYSL
jgi:hypothetical protein